MSVFNSNSVLLSGLDGSNPLAFLAALGTLRVLSKMYPTEKLSMTWRVEDGAWRPVLVSSVLSIKQEALCDSLAEWLADPPQIKLLDENEIGDNLTISPSRFHELAHKYLQSVIGESAESMVALEYFAAFGTDTTYQPHSKDHSLMQDTALRTMSGAGHQHFVKFMREIVANTSSLNLYSTLFRPWTYEDEGRGMNLRWDPIDDRRYAMRWKNPSADPAKTMRGANRLAIEGLPLFPTATIGTRLQTTGFRSKRGAFWSWPIWDGDLEFPVIQGLLQLAAISTENSPEQRDALRRRGISEIYESQRITIGKFRNFTPSKTK